MIADLGDGEPWPAPVRAAMNDRDVLATGTAILEAGMGMKALLTIEKRPVARLTPHGVRDATADPHVLWEWWASWPETELAVVLGDRFGCADIDRPDFDTGAWGVPRTWSERTHRGRHEMMGLTRPALKCRLPDGAGDFITGNAAYVVLAPSADRWPVDPDAPIRMLPDDAPLWATIDALAAPKAACVVLGFTDDDYARAGVVLDRLRASEYGATVRDIVAGTWQDRYPSRSEADAALALMATHHLRDDPRRAEIVAALLFRHSRKAPDHRNPSQYIGIVTGAVIAERDRIDTDRLDLIRATIQRGAHRLHTLPYTSSNQLVVTGQTAPSTRHNVPSPSTRHNVPSPSTRHNVSPTDPNPLRVSDGTLSRGLDVTMEVIKFVLGVEPGDRWAGEAGWVRVPVSDLSTVLECDRKTVGRHITKLESAGRIDTQLHRKCHDGGVRADRWVRLAPP